MSKKDETALAYLAELYGAKTPFEIYRVTERLSGKARKESQKDAGFRPKTKANIPFEAEMMQNKNGK